MAGTLTPTPYQTVLDGDGVAVSGAKIYTYEAGTTTNATTYTTSALSVANANPIVADSAGRYVAYLSAGANLRFIIKTSADVTIDDQDNVQAVPGTSVNLDIEGTVGEAVTAGQVLYLSSAAESSPLTAGKWYLTDSDAAATSTTPQSIGVAVSAIAINTAGTIRLAGEVDAASSVVVGTTYYVGATPGAIVSSAPALSRQVGVAITTSSLLLAATTAVVGALPNPITQDLLFTDATYDIGKSGASRPRDVFASRNAAVGGTLGVSGISTFTADLVATGASMSFQDDEGITLGTGDDATVKYDGTNVSLDTQAVGSGLLIVTGSAAISGVEIDNTAGDGDPTLAFTLSGTSLFTMGVDDGDSDKFKIGTTAIGTSTALTIDGSQNVGLGTAAPVSLLDVRGPTGTGATPAGLLTLATNELTIVDNDQLGRIEFRSPIATAGTDAIVSAAAIWAEANATFSSSVNSADIVFATAASGAATEKMRILSTGNVGIGNAAPTSPLVVQNSDGTNSHIRISQDSDPGTNYWGLRRDGSGDFKLSSSGTDRLTVLTSGKVGIGNATPDASRLDLGLITDSDATLSTTVSDYQFNLGSATTSGEYGHAICFSDGSTISAAINGYDSGASGGMALRFATMSTAGAFADRLTINHNGNVGIGTTAPGSKLDISVPAGAAQLTIQAGTSDSVTGEASIKLISRNSGSGSSPPAEIRNIWGGSNDSDLAFYTTTDGSTMVEQMRINDVGLVGIGTTAPGSYAGVQTNLEVKTASHGGIALNVGADSFGGLFFIANDVSKWNLAMENAASPDLTFYEGSTIRMTLNDGGTVNVAGTFTAGTKTFQIPHPLPEKSENYLVHACLEGPRLDLIYRGVATLVDGAATVDLDDAAGMTAGTWALLCRDAQVFTTNETGWFHVRGTVSGSTLTIECEEGTCTDTVSWMVVAERQDDAIKAQSSTDEDGHLILEPLKSPPDTV